MKSKRHTDHAEGVEAPAMPEPEVIPADVPVEGADAVAVVVAEPVAVAEPVPEPVAVAEPVPEPVAVAV